MGYKMSEIQRPWTKCPKYNVHKVQPRQMKHPINEISETLAQLSQSLH